MLCSCIEDQLKDNTKIKIINYLNPDTSVNKFLVNRNSVSKGRMDRKIA